MAVRKRPGGALQRVSRLFNRLILVVANQGILAERPCLTAPTIIRKLGHTTRFAFPNYRPLSSVDISSTQGVVLHGLGLLYKATGDHKYVDEALVTLDAALKSKTKDNVLAETCDLPPSGNCNFDQVRDWFHIS